MDQTKIKAAATKEFNDGDANTKKALIKIFGEGYFTSIFDYDSWEKIAALKNIDPVKDLPYPKPINNLQIRLNGAFQLEHIYDVFRGGEDPDYTNSKQEKWWAVFNNYTSGSGFRFVHSRYDWTTTMAGGGARFVVFDKKTSDFLGTTFLDIWNKFLNPIK